MLSVSANVFWILLFVVAAANAYADRITSVAVEGTRFQVILDSGRVLDSAALSGALLDLALPNGAKQRIRILSVTLDPRDPDGEVLLHRMAVVDGDGSESELCQLDPQGERWAFPLRGQWDEEGQRLSDAGFTLTCSDGAQGKCVRFGYKPWKVRPDGVALAPFHAACVKAVRADYCGDRATTRDGQLIDIYDSLGIQHRDSSPRAADIPFEAAFSPQGAVCVAHTRVPANITLDALAATCPRLAGRAGQAACVEGDAVAGHYGPALIFIRSPENGRSSPPLQVVAPAREPAGWPAGQSPPLRLKP